MEKMIYIPNKLESANIGQIKYPHFSIQITINKHGFPDSHWLIINFIQRHNQESTDFCLYRSKPMSQK